MKKTFIDTNIFLEIFVRKGEKSESCLSKIASEKGLWTNTIVLLEIEWVLRSAYNLPRAAITQCLRFILSKKNIALPHRNDFFGVVSFYESSSIDLADCMNAFECKRSQCKRVYSFDRHYSHFPWLKRLEP